MKGTGIEVKCHRFRDVYCTNKLRDGIMDPRSRAREVALYEPGTVLSESAL